MWRQYWVSLRVLIVATIVLGIAYPLLITGIGQLVLPSKANGSPVSYQGSTIGSSLLGQSFTDKKGNPLPQWFQSRPSAAGAGYDATASSGSSLGPNNPALVQAIDGRKKIIEKLDGVTASQIPADALTASGSGLDPHISPAYARLQVTAVANARGISVASVRALVEKYVDGPELGYLGDPRVNVLQLNLALAKMDPSGNK